MIIVCDTFDWSDYPVFVMPGESVHQRTAEEMAKSMQKVMEVYKLADDWDAQLGEYRAFHY